MKWRECDCGYEECKAKVRVSTHGKYILVEFVTTEGILGEAFFTVANAKLLLKDLEDAIKKGADADG